jgi:hypothetical protein
MRDGATLGRARAESRTARTLLRLVRTLPRIAGPLSETTPTPPDTAPRLLHRSRLLPEAAPSLLRPAPAPPEVAPASLRPAAPPPELAPTSLCPAPAPSEVPPGSLHPAPTLPEATPTSLHRASAPPQVTPRSLRPALPSILTHATSGAISTPPEGKESGLRAHARSWRRLLEDAAKAGPPAAPPKKKAAAEKPKKKTLAAKPKAEKTAAQATLSELLVEGALAQIQEVVDGGDDPSKMLGEPKRKKGLRGRFTETVQSIFAGNEPAELRRLLRDDLAPFVDGPALALALAEVGDDIHGDLVDRFAIRAIDDLARALVALALARPDDVPATCRPFGRALDGYVDQARAALEG